MPEPVKLSFYQQLFHPFDNDLSRSEKEDLFDKSICIAILTLGTVHLGTFLYEVLLKDRITHLNVFDSTAKKVKDSAGKILDAETEALLQPDKDFDQKLKKKERQFALNSHEEAEQEFKTFSYQTSLPDDQIESLLKNKELLKSHMTPAQFAKFYEKMDDVSFIFLKPDLFAALDPKQVEHFINHRNFSPAQYSWMVTEKQLNEIDFSKVEGRIIDAFIWRKDLSDEQLNKMVLALADKQQGPTNLKDIDFSRLNQDSILALKSLYVDFESHLNEDQRDILRSKTIFQ